MIVLEDESKMGKLECADRKWVLPPRVAAFLGDGDPIMHVGGVNRGQHFKLIAALLTVHLRAYNVRICVLPRKLEH